MSAVAIDRGELMDLVYDLALVVQLPRLRPPDPNEGPVDLIEHDTRSAWAGLVCRICISATPGEA